MIFGFVFLAPDGQRSHLTETVGAPWKVLVAPLAPQACDEDTVGAVFECEDGFDVIDHPLAKRAIGEPELVAIDRAQEFQRAFLGVDGNNPFTGSEGMGIHVRV